MSLTSSQQQTIENEVGIWMDANRMFTAFEISRAVKAKGVGLRHREMKEFIHAAIYRRRSRSYTRTLLDVGAPQQAWLYHPLSKNPHTFRPLQRNDGGKPGSSDALSQQDQSTPSTFHTRNLVSLADANSAQPASTDGSYGCDNEGNLKVPSSEMSKIGIGPDEVVHVLSDPAHNEIVIGKPGTVDADGADVESTSANGDFLVTHEMLEFVDLDWLAGYGIRVVDETLHVSELS